MNSINPILSVDKLKVNFVCSKSESLCAVFNISLNINRGEIVAIVGESGSGKSVTALSIMQLLPYPFASHGEKSSIIFDGKELINSQEKYMRTIRGKKISMIFQEPLTSLNPLHSIGKQIGESLYVHNNLKGEALNEKIKELLDKVGLSDLKDRTDAYPHELSGGQRQRVMIAMAIANNPDLLIADEPTTALDVTVQAQILELLQSLCKEMNMALLLITHDLGIVEKIADSVHVMQSGSIVESGSTAKIFNSPKTDYTKKLLSSRNISKVPEIESSSDILKTDKIRVYFPKKKNFFGFAQEYVKAVDDIRFEMKKGRTTGLVGESGSGKSTLGYALLRLINSEGDIFYDGQNITSLKGKDMKQLRSAMQIVFQDPFGSLSPRMSVGQIIGEGLSVHKKMFSKEERENEVVNALIDVGMDPDTRHRYPHEFSGGQRQRISIARALVLKPEFMVLDEPSSALDVTVQAQIIELLRKLQKEYNLTYLFISHDLRVVRGMAHDLAVMKGGKIIEYGTADEIFNNPKHEYTRQLLNAAFL